MTTKVDLSLLELIINCRHCGEVHISMESHAQAYLNFTSKSPLAVKTCPICGEEAKVKE
jgi:transcription elongation factor Elf1